MNTIFRKLCVALSIAILVSIASTQSLATTECADCSITTYEVNDFSWLSKSKTVTGQCWWQQIADDEYEYEDEDERFQGVVSLKLGAFNKKKQTSRVTAIFTPIVGKKQTATVELSGEGGEFHGFLPFKGSLGTMEIWVWYDEDCQEIVFEGACEDTGYWLCDGGVGGLIDSDVLWFSAGDELEEILADANFGGYDVLWDVTSFEHPISVKKGKTLDAGKAASPFYMKGDDGTYDLAILTCPDANYLGLKLSYNAKTGAIKGSFNVLLTNAEYISETKKPKIKKLKINFNGYYLCDWGMAIATVKIGRETHYIPIYFEPCFDDCEVSSCG